MADLTALNVDVNLTQDDIDRSPDRVGLRTFPSISFGNGALTYPALGIPMPDIGKFGMNFAIKRVYIEQPANGYVYHFDRANHKIRIFQSAGFTPAGTNAAPTITIAGSEAGTVAIGIASDANGAALSKTAATSRTGITGVQAPAFTGTPVAAGALVELGNVAVPATVLNLEVVGR